MMTLEKKFPILRALNLLKINNCYTGNTTRGRGRVYFNHLQLLLQTALHRRMVYRYVVLIIWNNRITLNSSSNNSRSRIEREESSTRQRFFQREMSAEGTLDSSSVNKTIKILTKIVKQKHRLSSRLITFINRYNLVDRSHSKQRES